MLVLKFVREASKTSEIFTVFDDAWNKEVATVELCYDWGDTLCDVIILEGNLTKEEIELIYEDGCVKFEGGNLQETW